MIRPGALAAVAVVAALLGGSLALALGKATGWLGDSDTIFVAADGTVDGTARAVDDSAAAKPLPGNDFAPATIYRERAAGVVTILALFGQHTETGEGGAAQGSGFVVSGDGYVLTNSHVITTAGEGAVGAAVEAATSIYVEFRDGDRVPARVVGWDLYDDVGVLKIDPEDDDLVPVPLGDSNQVEVGEPVAAIGSPFGQMSSLSVGVVAATERSIDSLTSTYDLVDAIQTDAPINRGNSGGPMFDARGLVIGINAQIRSESGNAEGVGFAIPINAAKRSMRQLVEFGEVRYAWVGVSTQSLTPSLADRFDYQAERGAAVQSVVEGSPAARAGLRGGGEEKVHQGVFFRPGGDLIVAIDDTEIDTAEDVVRVVASQLLPGQTVTFTVLRGGRERQVEITLGKRPAQPPGSDR